MNSPAHTGGSEMSKGKILVVDDEVYIVQILEFSLSRIEGYDVATATDGEEALEKGLANGCTCRRGGRRRSR